jgi:CheY-like chemotaxis protein
MAKIVCCEDSALIRKMIGAALQPTAHEVFLAADGAEGFALVEREGPDLVLTDVSMPVMGGFELADALKARPDLAHIPIVFLTAGSEAVPPEEAAQHGGVAYLTKPFTPGGLRAKVDEVLAGPGP